jgi:hypothetical protein
MTIRRRFLTLVLMAILALFVAVVPSSAGGGDNIVVVSNTTDGQTLSSASTQVIPTPMDSVTSSNIAVAVNAGCTDCHSSAVAVQVLIVVGSPQNFQPGNATAAANGGCESCGAYAYARQHWIQISGPAVLDGTARAQIDQIRQEIANDQVEPPVRRRNGSLAHARPRARHRVERARRSVDPGRHLGTPGRRRHDDDAAG